MQGHDATAGLLKVQEERQQWKKAHKIMKDSPPSGGRDYLMHARNLLLLLEGIAEIHPVSKVVVSSFKTIVMFETDRRDNDVRVTAVFLAQTDTMQILLDIDDISVRQRDREDLKGLRSNAMLGSLLETVAKDIKECGNSIDAYYKESRFVKFWKSQDWKGRMLNYVDVFSRHRTHLQQIISVQVAAGVGDLVSKMDEVLSRLYRPKSQWERDLDSETRRLGDPAKWMDDQSTLRDLISMTDDPAFPLLPTTSQETGAPLAYYNSEQARRAELESSLIERIRGKLSLSLDVICERNMDRFELKLNFYMLQMQEAIQESTQTIVHALSGPFDRLENKDLRELWKEMDWIFCVENKLFFSALFEYYLDLFSTRRVDMSSSAQTLEKDASYLARSKWDKSGSIRHVDAWTLDYLVVYGQRIAAAIDDDDSGFIRISEANAFTRKIPFGWNLPQWCAYSAVGWLFEARIYRKRINNLLSKLKEANIEVLPANRTWVGFSIGDSITADLCGAFWREPRGNLGISKPSISLQLKGLVKDKMLSQDVALRSKLSSLKWTIDAASIIDILFGETPVESFILQLIAIMLEYVLKVVFICSKATLDVREWERIIATFEVMRQICIARVDSLKGKTAERDGVQLNLDLEQFCGGIWSHFDAQRNELKRDISNEASYDFWGIYSANGYTLDDYRDFISDSSFLDNFPLPSPSDANPYLEYRPWEEVTQSMATEDIPSVIPNSWDASGSLSEVSRWEGRIMGENINHGWRCNQCGAEDPEKRYHCAECLDIDFCAQCFTVSKEDCKVQQHEPHHPLIIISFNVMPHQLRILEAEAKHHLDEVQYSLRGRQPEKSHQLEPESPTNNSSDRLDDFYPGSDFVCEICSQDISLNSVFYKCIGNSQCKNVFLCEVCAKPTEDRGYIQHHKWWHHLLVLRSDILEKFGEAQASSLPLNALDPNKIPRSADEPKNNAVSASTAIAAVSDSIQATFEAKLTALEDILKSNTAQIDERIAGLEETLHSSNSMLEERMSKLESKLDDMMDKLQEWFTNARRT